VDENGWDDDSVLWYEPKTWPRRPVEGTIHYNLNPDAAENSRPNTGNHMSSTFRSEGNKRIADRAPRHFEMASRSSGE
jgi:hypothetical protein